MQKDDKRYLEEVYQYSFLMSTLQQNISSLTDITLYRGFFNSWICYALREDGVFTSNCDWDSHFECVNSFWYDQQTHALACTGPVLILHCFWLGQS